MRMHRPRALRPVAELLGAAALLLGVAQSGESLAAAPGTAAKAAVSSTASTLSNDDDPRSWLARTDRALASRNYRGIFVHEYASETETLRVVQRVGSDGVSERLQSLDGSGREFIRRGTQLLCFLPDRHLVLVEHSSNAGLLLGGLPSLQAALTGEYDVRQIQRTRVSGRTARVIAIEPRDQLRYGYRVWIDEATAMPLRTQLRDAHGHMLEQIVFTDLELPAHIAANELTPAVDARSYRWVQQDVPTATDPSAPAPALSWQASALPPGFRMTASANQMMPGGPAEHLVFSDGIASVSVFLQARSVAGLDAAAGGHDDSATLGTSSAYSTAAQGYRITVVGEVPPETVRDIAQAIRATVPSAALAESGLGMPGMPGTHALETGSAAGGATGSGAGARSAAAGLPSDAAQGGLHGPAGGAGGFGALGFDNRAAGGMHFGGGGAGRR